MSVKVRPATSEDLAVLGRMGAGLVHYHHDLDPLRYMLPADDLEAGYRWWLGKELRHKKVVLLVAERGGEVVGYVYGRAEGKDWGKLLDAHGELIDLWVEDAARRTGAGRALVSAIVRRFGELGLPRVVLYSAYENTRAQALFKSLGFRPTMVELTVETGADS